MMGISYILIICRVYNLLFQVRDCVFGPRRSLKRGIKTKKIYMAFANTRRRRRRIMTYIRRGKNTNRVEPYNNIINTYIIIIIKPKKKQFGMRIKQYNIKVYVL